MKITRPNIDFNDEDIALLQLSLCDGIGPKLSYQLLEQFGSALEIFRAAKKDYRTSGAGAMPSCFFGLSPQKQLQLQQAASLIEASDTLNLHLKLQIQIVTINHPNYPSRIKEQQGAPLVLYYLGNPTWDLPYTLSIVGTRKPTQRGISTTKEIVADVNQQVAQSWCSVSGLAMGIDAVAHKSSLELNVPTVAVVAHGLEQVYPRNHLKLAQEICYNGGAIVSEHPAFTKMHPTLFPRRNRLVAALGDALLISESTTTGGSMVTAGIACHLNKEVFAIPGHPKDALSVGCNSLIQENMAHLCCSGWDIVNKMNWGISQTIKNTKTNKHEISAPPPTSVAPLQKNELEILNCIQSGVNRLQDIAQAMPFCSTAEILSALTALQLSGILVKENQQRFCIVGPINAFNDNTQELIGPDDFNQ